ncbi:DUF2062 domain-containing protein [Prochlorococcus sp. MIT 1306]|uniref:DUF2062 domain-containing protein n=1 Tax=Prochlorococcus sp. MIT 1306 TaxID=1799667 RepID=UPI0007B3BCDD|nr:DUF2062 domain-containing protein [Prochlorococcus sp. MIT 1306]KZR61385.1 hypothetical protein PMIT1306_02166 [Prochlorococcus sp. MIT 1306]
MIQKTLQGMSRRLRRWLVWLWQQEGTPGQRARGVAAGVFSGCFPFFGLQTLLGVALASVVRGNHVLAAIGTWISNPITYLPLYWFNYQVGSSLLGQGQNDLDLTQLNEQDLWTQGWVFSTRLLLGSSLVGAIAALFTSCAVYGLLKGPAKAKSRQRIYRRRSQSKHD